MSSQINNFKDYILYFYRIEDESGKGMYRNRAKQEKHALNCPVGTFAARLCTSVWTHNPPDCDFPDFFSIYQKKSDQSYYFGFKSIHQLYKWFDTVQAITFLKKMGFKISKYEIERQYTDISDTQLIFKKGKERFVEHIDFNINNLKRITEYSSNFKPEDIKLIYRLGL